MGNLNTQDVTSHSNTALMDFGIKHTTNVFHFTLYGLMIAFWVVDLSYLSQLLYRRCLFYLSSCYSYGLNTTALAVLQ